MLKFHYNYNIPSLKYNAFILTFCYLLIYNTYIVILWYLPIVQYYQQRLSRENVYYSKIKFTIWHVSI